MGFLKDIAEQLGVRGGRQYPTKRIIRVHLGFRVRFRVPKWQVLTQTMILLTPGMEPYTLHHIDAWDPGPPCIPYVALVSPPPAP